jgi:hypothetical protein
LQVKTDRAVDRLSIRKYIVDCRQMERQTAGREMKTMGSRFSKVEEDRYTLHKSKDNCAVYTNRTEERIQLYSAQMEQKTLTDR